MGEKESKNQLRKIKYYYQESHQLPKKTIKLKIKAPNTNNNIITQLPRKTNKNQNQIKKPSQQPANHVQTDQY